MNDPNGDATTEMAMEERAAPVPSAVIASAAIFLALTTIPGSRWLADHDSFFVSFIKWPVLIVGIVLWAVAAKRWAAVERASKFIFGFYVVLGVTYLFIR